MKKKQSHKKVIYCWKCGLENPKSRWHCKDKKCHAPLKQREHPILYWLFGEIKDDTEEGIIKRICDLLKNFFELHLYGTTFGLAFIFTAAATLLHFDTSKEATITENEYYLPKIVETQENEETLPASPVKVEPQQAPSPKEEEKKPEASQEKQAQYDCYVDENWNGTYVGDGVCERIITPLARKTYSCPTGYSLNGTDCIGNEDVESAIRYYCASTVEEYTQFYGEPPCESHPDYLLQSTLHSEAGTCDYTLIDPQTNETGAGCLIFPGTRAIPKQGRYCSSSDLQPWGDYCRRVIPADIIYSCDSGELVGDRCRTVQRYYGRKLS